MSTSSDPERPHEPPRRAASSGVRTEHDLRVQLRRELERNTTLERAVRGAAIYAYGNRDRDDLRKLRAILSSAGFRDPNREPRSAENHDESAPPGRDS